jgi:hypothetical protein
MNGTAILKNEPMIGSHARGAQVVRCQHALHDQKIRGPVAEADHEAQAEDDAGPVHAHGIGGKVPVSRHRWK